MEDFHDGMTAEQYLAWREYQREAERAHFEAQERYDAYVEEALEREAAENA